MSSSVSIDHVSSSSIFFSRYSPSTSFPLLPRYVLILHGWLGCADDCHDLALSLVETGYHVLVPDLPFHRNSINVRPRSIYEAAQKLLNALDSLIPAASSLPSSRPNTPTSLSLIGYSLGGRIAQQLALAISYESSPSFFINSLLLVSSAPPPCPDTEYHHTSLCTESSQNLSLTFLATVSDCTSFEKWLRTSWYTCSMWGRLSSSPTFNRLIQSRLRNFSPEQRQAWGQAVVSLSTATMSQPSHRLRLPVLYICGMLDVKYVRFTPLLQSHYMRFDCVQVPKCGHNVLFEQPSLLRSCAAQFLHRTYPLAEDRLSVTIDSLCATSYIIALRKPLMVNSKLTITRSGFLVFLCTPTDKVGVGDICPLPGLHQHSVLECEQLVQSFSDSLDTRFAILNPFHLEAIENDLKTLPPVIRNGLLCALVHAASRVVGQSIQKVLSVVLRLDFIPKETVFMNGVLPQVDFMLKEHYSSDKYPDHFTKFVSESKFDTLKLKVGAQRVLDDARMTSSAMSVAESRQKRVRLDANRAWDLDQFDTFQQQLEKHAEKVQFIEEPLRTTQMLQQYLTRPCGMFIALDECIPELENDEIRKMAASPLCKALVLKPAVIGSLLRLGQLARIATETGCEVVLSCCFESSVGTAWTAVLAAVLANSDARHGLGTYKYLNEINTYRKFEACVAGSMEVTLSRCEELLDESSPVVVVNSSDEDEYYGM